MILSELLTEYLESHKMTQTEFAQRCGISKAYVSMIINSRNPKTGKPPVLTVAKYNGVAKAMDMTMDELFKIIDDAPIDISGKDDDEASDIQLIPKTSEARAVSGWMDDLPETQRKFIESLVATAIKNLPT